MQVPGNILPVFALEKSHACNEDGGIQQSPHRLIQNHLLDRIDPVQRQVSIVVVRVTGKLGLHVLLPHDVGRAGEESEEDELEDGDPADPERNLDGISENSFNQPWTGQTSARYALMIWARKLETADRPAA